MSLFCVLAILIIIKWNYLVIFRNKIEIFDFKSICVQSSIFRKDDKLVFSQKDDLSNINNVFL